MVGVRRLTSGPTLTGPCGSRSHVQAFASKARSASSHSMGSHLRTHMSPSIQTIYTGGHTPAFSHLPSWPRPGTCPRGSTGAMTLE